MPAGSLKGLQLVVADLNKAHVHLKERGVEVSDVQVMGESPSENPLNNVGFIFFSDPDGNGWACPGRTVSDPAVMNRPLAEQRATYIVCSFENPDDVAAMRNESNWTFRKLEVGHWAMVAAPIELADLLLESAEQVNKDA